VLPVCGYKMEWEAFNKWANDRIESDDDIDDLLVTLLCTREENLDVDSELAEVYNRKHEGSRIGRSPNIYRNHLDFPDSFISRM
jgi:hypothetical protein